MKTPTVYTRRNFLGNCGVASLGVAMPQFLLHTAESVAMQNGWERRSAAPLPGFKDDHVLVVVQLSGGNDGLNTVVPRTNDAYHRARPRLALQPRALLRIDDEVSLNVNMSGFKDLYDKGNVAIIEGVGYPNPNRSHFRSTEIWHTASDSDRFAPDGWVGRYFDNNCSGKPGPLVGVNIGAELPQAFDGTGGFGVAFESPRSFGYVAGRNGDDMRSFKMMNSKGHRTGNKTLDFLRHVTDSAVVSTERVQKIAGDSKNSVRYPQSGLARALAIVARMISGGLGTRLYYVTLGGFDTHANQENTHNRLMREYSEAISAFHRDLKKMRQSERVISMTFSEFGRRVGENGSQGTDHGTAAPMFVIGDAIMGGLKGKRPSLTNLDQGDLKFTGDFRSVYASVIHQWLNADPVSVLGREFPEFELIGDKTKQNLIST